MHQLDHNLGLRLLDRKPKRRQPRADSPALKIVVFLDDLALELFQEVYFFLRKHLLEIRGHDVPLRWLP